MTDLVRVGGGPAVVDLEDGGVLICVGTGLRLDV